MKIYHKFKAVRCEADGIKFPSKKERDYYLYLKEKEKSGELYFHLRQVPFQLPGNTKYFLDFIEFWKTGEDGTAEIKFTEIKGRKIPLGVLKVKQAMEIYNIDIEVK